MSIVDANVAMASGPYPTRELAIGGTEYGSHLEGDRWALPSAGQSADRAARVSKRKTALPGGGEGTAGVEVLPASQLFPAETAAHSPPASIPEWAAELRVRYPGHTAHTLEYGCTVHASKLSLTRGKWERMFRERRENGVPFGKTTGKKWDSIGEVCGPIGQEPDHLAKLPGTFEALYQLSRLGINLLRQAIQDGAVHSGLNETTAREVAQHYNPKLKRKPRPFKTRRFLAQTRASLESLLASKEAGGNLTTVLAEFQEMTELIAKEVAVRRHQTIS